MSHFVADRLLSTQKLFIFPQSHIHGYLLGELGHDCRFFLRENLKRLVGDAPLAYIINFMLLQKMSGNLLCALKNVFTAVRTQIPMR